MNATAEDPKMYSALLDALHRIRGNRAALEKAGVLHVDIFGSVTRGEDGPESDVDILVDVDPFVVRDLFAYAELRLKLERIVGRRVDVARRGRTRPELAGELDRDAVRVY